jgi:hypothetical protein
MKKTGLFFPQSLLVHPRIDEMRMPQWAQLERLEYCQPPTRKRR